MRHVPAFPDRPLSVGDRWIHPGEEALDLRQVNGITVPILVPFNGNYQYRGLVEHNGGQYHHIHLTYTWTTQIPEGNRMAQRRRGEDALRTIRGQFEQNIYWNVELGQPAWYEETYSHTLTFESGHVYIMRGTASAHLIESIPMDRSAVADELTREIDRLGLENISIIETDDGVTIVLEDIQFSPNSAILLPSELEKLEHLAELLRAYAGRDLEIVGHTARAGSENAAQRLSEQRALSVANFLINRGVKRPENIMTRGEGSRSPIASNSTAEGMAQNRRVEINIREN